MRHQRNEYTIHDEAHAEYDKRYRVASPEVTKPQGLTLGKVSCIIATVSFLICAASHFV